MTRTQHRPSPEGHVAQPVLKLSDWSRALRWWRPESGIPRRCAECNASLTNEPPQWERFGRVYCLLGCARQYAWISSVGWEL
jgi:hypothetical protein